MTLNRVQRRIIVVQ